MIRLSHYLSPFYLTTPKDVNVMSIARASQLQLSNYILILSASLLWKSAILFLPEYLTCHYFPLNIIYIGVRSCCIYNIASTHEDQSDSTAVSIAV